MVQLEKKAPGLALGRGSSPGSGITQHYDECGRRSSDQCRVNHRLPCSRKRTGPGLAARSADKRKNTFLVFLGFAIGWVSATIARYVDPPPKKYRPSRKGDGVLPTVTSAIRHVRKTGALRRSPLRQPPLRQPPPRRGRGWCRRRFRGDGCRAGLARGGVRLGAPRGASRRGRQGWCRLGDARRSGEPAGRRRWWWTTARSRRRQGHGLGGRFRRAGCPATRGGSLPCHRCSWPR